MFVLLGVSCFWHKDLSQTSLLRRVTGGHGKLHPGVRALSSSGGTASGSHLHHSEASRASRSLPPVRRRRVHPGGPSIVGSLVQALTWEEGRGSWNRERHWGQRPGPQRSEEGLQDPWGLRGHGTHGGGAPGFRAVKLQWVCNCFSWELNGPPRVSGENPRSGPSDRGGAGGKAKAPEQLEALCGLSAGSKGKVGAGRRGQVLGLGYGWGQGSTREAWRDGHSGAHLVSVSPARLLRGLWEVHRKVHVAPGPRDGDSLEPPRQPPPLGRGGKQTASPAGSRPHYFSWCCRKNWLRAPPLRTLLSWVTGGPGSGWGWSDAGGWGASQAHPRQPFALPPMSHPTVEGASHEPWALWTEVPVRGASS